jgi:hypothetical protein
MSATTIRYRGRVINHDPMTNPENGYVEGFYYQDLDNGVVKHYIFNCPMTWEVDPSTVRIIRHDNLPNYEIPVTQKNDIKELQERLVQTCIDYIKEKNLTDIDGVRFNVDGLTNDAIEYGEWTPAMDSYIGVEGLQDKLVEGKSGEAYKIKVRAFIGEYM